MYKNIYQFQRELNLRECVWGGNVIPCETLGIFHTGKETFFQINWFLIPGCGVFGLIGSTYPSS